MSIFEVQHQDRAHRILQRALHCGRLPHAYLFAGPEGVGREMLAIRLARVLLCSETVEKPWPDDVESTDMPAIDACGRCEDCQLVDAGTHPDLFTIYRQLNRLHPDSQVRKQKALVLGVDIIRHFLIEQAGHRPRRGRAKVFIVREAERLNDSAQNCLLKTLEEPPSRTFLILLTSALDRMLPTTRSRCQLVLFRSLPADFVADHLVRLRPQADGGAVAYAARHAEGSLGIAVRQVDDGLYELKRAWGDRLGELIRPARGFAVHKLAAPLLNDARQLAGFVSERDPDVSPTDASREGLRMLLAVLADFYRDALRIRAGSGLALVNKDQAGVVEALAAGYDDQRLGRSLRCLGEAETALARNANLDLTLETLLIRLAGDVRRA